MDTHCLYKLCTVIIIVLYSVKAQYSLTPSSSYAVKNREFHLTCNIGPSSTVPSFAINWRRNGQNVALVQSSNCQTYVGAGEDLYQRYTYNCTSNRSYSLYISATKINSEDGSVWRCGDNDINLGSSSDYTMNVNDPPTTDPVISGYSGTTTFLGSTVTLTCTWDGGSPLATLTWTCKGINVQGINTNTQTSAIRRYTVTIDTSYNGQSCTCTASHQLWSDNKVVQSQPFMVHYPPTTNPVVSGYDGTFRYQDDIVTTDMYCIRWVTSGYFILDFVMDNNIL
ncbi:hypothetical protein KUTeg_010631 [Tegillarca granosa]|uniref:Ig-like domain-containing protein n=1 Tax=Tegillarca granosa TaxID=220873 RepID=A0ABQ9F862_TEGGR|nr:hypothetical protein KUTeg_010631 [Tegillarca granosa]